METENKTEEEAALEASLGKAKANSNANHHQKLNITELNAKLKEELEKYRSG